MKNLLKIISLIFSLIIIMNESLAQNSVGIGTENPSANAVLQLVSPTNNQGFLVPRLNTAQRTADAFTSRLTVSDNGLMVFDTNLSTFFYWIGNRWELVSGQLLTGGAGVTIDENGVISVQPDVPQDLVLANNQLRITNNTSATVIDLTPYLNIQNASQVVVTPTATLTSGTVQAALEELQAEILNPPGNMLKSTYDPTNINGSAFDLATHTGTLPSTRITGLGTAATLNAGTGSNNLVQLDATGLPAVDGSRLTGLVLPQFPALGALSLLDVVGSTEITDNSIFNADINIAAQIAGTKITPNFGGQNVSTTGSITTNDIFINNQLQIADGTEGLGKILVSDASGTTSWQSATGTSWGIAGNAGMVDGTNFIGTTDGAPLNFVVNNQDVGQLDDFGNVFFGLDAGINNTATDNTFIGSNSGQTNTSGDFNAFYGSGSGASNTIGADNTLIGFWAGLDNTTGISNTFVGSSAGESNTTAGNNSFFGADAGFANTTGNDNSFFGSGSGSSNTTGLANSFFGDGSGFNNTIGIDNSFFGRASGLANTTGNRNSFYGTNAGAANTTGDDNSFFGQNSGLSNTTGADNVFVGINSGSSNTTGVGNTFSGARSGFNNTTASNNAFFGESAGFANTTGTDNAFFGTAAGVNNSTASFNSFFGRLAGLSNTTGNQNTFVGYAAGQSNTIANNNAFFGESAGLSNTTGSENSFFGGQAAVNNTTGANNSFFGYASGYFNTVGGGNSSFGYSAASDNTTGNSNTTMGFQAANLNTVGSNNTMVGAFAGKDNTASGNSFFGYASGQNNTTGTGNTFIGSNSGNLNIGGAANSFFGSDAGKANTFGAANSFFGVLTGAANTSGSSNAFFGVAAGEFNTTGTSNSFFGQNAGASNIDGNNNTLLGLAADVLSGNLSNATAIGYNAKVSASNSLVLGGTGADAVNVGIGITAPTQRLDVNGNIRFRGNLIPLGPNGVDDINMFFVNNVSITTGIKNFGWLGGHAITTGSYNVILGNNAGFGLTTGGSNILMGTNSGSVLTTGGDNVFIGTSAAPAATGSNNVAIGGSASISAGISNASAIGPGATATVSNTMVFGAGFLTGWGFGTQPGGAAIRVGTNGSNGNGATLTTGGTWTNASDRNKKENFTQLNPNAILDKVRSLPITRWNYIGESADQSHIGPMAQDFYKAFQTGGDDTSISTIDPSGVALVAIQALLDKVERLEKENELLRKDNIIFEANQEKFSNELEQLKKLILTSKGVAVTNEKNQSKSL
jgi:hypothetical protein